MRRSVGIAVLGTLLSLVGAREAGAFEESFRVGVTGAFGFGSKVRYDSDEGNHPKEDALVTAGFALLGEYPILRALVGPESDFFRIGATVQFLFWGEKDWTDHDVSRAAWIDVDLWLKGRYAFLEDRLEVYLAIPVGLTIGVLDDEAYEPVYGAALRSPVAGWNIGLLVGTSYRFWKGLGAMLHLGFRYHWLKSEANDIGYALEVPEFALDVGMFYAF